MYKVCLKMLSDNREIILSMFDSEEEATNYYNSIDKSMPLLSTLFGYGINDEFEYVIEEAS